MEVGVHLPQCRLVDQPLDATHVAAVVDAAREVGLAAVAANDHLAFSRTVARRPDPARGGRPAGGPDGPRDHGARPRPPGPGGHRGRPRRPGRAGPRAGGRRARAWGSSVADHRLAGLPFEQRWSGFERAVGELRTLLAGRSLEPEGPRLAAPPTPVPLWIGSWGSAAGLRRVARLGDGWLASAYNTARPASPRASASFATSSAAAPALLPARAGHDVDVDHRGPARGRPRRRGAARAVAEPGPGRPAGPLVRRAPGCAELLSEYAEAGCRGCTSGRSRTSVARSSCSPPRCCRLSLVTQARPDLRPSGSINGRAPRVTGTSQGGRPRSGVPARGPAWHRPGTVPARGQPGDHRHAEAGLGEGLDGDVVVGDQGDLGSNPSSWQVCADDAEPDAGGPAPDPGSALQVGQGDGRSPRGQPVPVREQGPVGVVEQVDEFEGLRWSHGAPTVS